MLEKIFTQIRYRFFDYWGKPREKQSDPLHHLETALSWFYSSLLPEGGGAAKYSLMTHQFSAAYPMSTANWVLILSRIKNYYPTIYDNVINDPNTIHGLVKWILRTQRRDGTFPAAYGDFMNQPPRVFNNGMIIHSLLDYHNEYGGTDLMTACMSSADWLLEVQSPDGSWRQFTNYQLSSNTMTASALIRLAGITGDKRYAEAGEKNIQFALGLQAPNGYFKGNGFDSSDSAFTITIAYAIAGVFEAGILTGNEQWKKAALNALVPIYNKVGANGFLVGELDENFHSSSSYTCLPGNSLLAVIGYKMGSLAGNNELIQKADLLTNYVKGRQMKSKVLTINGGVPGSWPISGNYCSYEIPSWSVGYFAEALIMQDTMH